MRRRRTSSRTVALVVATVVSCLLGAQAAAQDGTKGSPAPKRDPATFDALKVAADELPKGTTIVEGRAFVSVQADLFAEDPTVHGVLPKPKRSATQTFAGEDGGKGTIVVLEYDGGVVPALVLDFFPSYLWGKEGRRSRQHPEEFVTQGALLVLLSFPAGDPTSEWLKARLRRRFGIRILAAHVELGPLIAQIAKAYEENDAERGLKLIADREKDVADVSLPHYFRGELAAMAHDWPTAERGYRRALELDESLEDPLPGQLGWAAMDGLGIALIAQKKYDEAVAALERCIDAGRASKVDAKNLATASYNLACALARLRRFDEAAKAFADAIAGNEKFKTSALTDEDLAEAIGRPEFQKLLGR